MLEELAEEHGVDRRRRQRETARARPRSRGSRSCARRSARGSRSRRRAPSMALLSPTTSQPRALREGREVARERARRRGAGGPRPGAGAAACPGSAAGGTRGSRPPSRAGGRARRRGLRGRSRRGPAAGSRRRGRGQRGMRGYDIPGPGVAKAAAGRRDAPARAAPSGLPDLGAGILPAASTQKRYERAYEWARRWSTAAAAAAAGAPAGGRDLARELGRLGALDLLVDQDALAGVVDLLGRRRPTSRTRSAAGRPTQAWTCSGGIPPRLHAASPRATKQADDQRDGAHAPMLHHRAAAGDAPSAPWAGGAARMKRA